MEENRSERLLFWPDRKGIALRQVQAILAKRTRAPPIRQRSRARAWRCRGWGRWNSCFRHRLRSAGERRWGVPLPLWAGDCAAVLPGWPTSWWRAGRRRTGIAQHLMRPQPDYADYRTGDRGAGGAGGHRWRMASRRSATRGSIRSSARTARRPSRSSALFWRSGMTMPMAARQFRGAAASCSAVGYGQAVPAEQ